MANVWLKSVVEVCVFSGRFVEANESLAPLSPPPKAVCTSSPKSHPPLPRVEYLCALLAVSSALEH